MQYQTEKVRGKGDAEIARVSERDISTLIKVDHLDGITIDKKGIVKY